MTCLNPDRDQLNRLGAVSVALEPLPSASTNTGPAANARQQPTIGSSEIQQGLSPDCLKRLIQYHPETGEMFWLPRGPEMFSAKARSSEANAAAWNTRYAGKPALHSISCYGYRRGGINGRNVFAHRAAWAIAYGVWPDLFIDHLNGVRTDNRLCNLRLADHRINGINKPGPRGEGHVAGVSFLKHIGKWQARCGRLILGYFGTFEEALSARQAFEESLGGMPASDASNFGGDA